MWDLDAAKKQFVSNNNGSLEHSFWYHMLKQQGQWEIVDDPELKLAFDWKPERSNCPELNLAVNEVLKVINPAWTTLLNGVFVGRVFAPELNAWAHQRNGKAYVRLSFQYTTVLAAYIAAFDRFTDLAMTGTDLPVKDIFHGISVSRKHWASEESFAGTHRALLDGPKNRSAELYNGLVLPAEMFIVCHEFAHHLLGHTSKKTKKRLGVEDDLRKQLATHRIGQHIWSRSESQKEELLSDVLGLKLAAKPAGNDTQVAYGTLIGAVCALVAEADIKNHWYADPDDEYPGTSDRIGLLLSLVPHIFNNLKPYGGGSIQHLAQQLYIFAVACRQSSLYSLNPESNPEPTWATINASVKNREMDYEF